MSDTFDHEQEAFERLENGECDILLKKQMKALIIVDVQYDFLPGGSLAVPDGDEIIPVITKLIDDSQYDVIIATQDWHPVDHCSFKDNGGIWPVHCVQRTKGAKIHEKIKADRVVQKGVSQDVDSYSGFWDNERKHETDLDDVLKILKITDVDICGLALDYCVMFTALDAAEAGYNTRVLINACRAVNIKSTDAENAIKKMKENNIVIV